MSTQATVRRTKTPSTHQNYNHPITSQNPSILKSTERDSLLARISERAKPKGLSKFSYEPIRGLSHKKLKESMQKTYKMYGADSLTGSAKKTTSKHRASASGRKAIQDKRLKNPKRATSKKVNVNSRVSHLQKALNSQEKMLYNLQDKLASEKTELSVISQQLSGKKHRDTADYDLNGQRHTSKSSPARDRYLISDDLHMKYDDDDKENNYRSAALGIRDTYLERNPSRILSNERILQACSVEDNYKHKWLSLKEHVSSIEGHYESKLKQLRQEVDRLSEENYRLKYRQGNGPGKDEVLERLESIYKGKIARAEEKCNQKEKEIIDCENNFKLEMDDVHRKLQHFQRDLKNSNNSEDRIGDLQRQLALREKEVGLLKKYYLEKLQMKADELAKQKDEWSRTQTDLLNETRDLKRNIDQLAYENKKLSLNANIKSTPMLTTSLRS